MASRTRARINNLNDRAREVGQSDELSLDDLNALKTFYDFTCLKCGAKPAISPDHVVPLALGGTNTVENLQLLCERCNKAKRAKSHDYRNGKILTREIANNLISKPKPKPKHAGGNPNWKKGMKSPNPAGRPAAGLSWAELVAAEGAKWSDEFGMTRKEWLVQRAFDHAEAGNAAILKEIWQRSEPQAQELNVNVDDKRLSPDERRSRIAELLERAGQERTRLVA